MRHNQLIRNVYTVHLIDETGKQLGKFGFREALKLANEKNLDLVEVNPNSNPPTCKIMDFGQYKYQQKKNKKPQHAELTKEVEISVGIGEHDMSFKTKHVQNWLSEGHKVLIKLRYRGREIQHSQLGYDQMNNMLSLLEQDSFTVESKPTLNGKLLTMLIRSNTKVTNK